MSINITESLTFDIPKMASNDVEVKLISQCFIKPKSRVEESKNPHYLLAGDLKWLAIRYIQNGFVYNKPNTNDFDTNSFVQKMKESLSRALVYYYPLAGRFTTVKYADEQACSIHVDCDKGPGALFIHASCVHATVSDIVGHTAYMLPLIGSFFNLGETELINYDGHTRALLTLQVTELKDGVCIGFTMNHSIADGTSFMHFVSSLSEIFHSVKNDEKMSISLSYMPIFEPFIPEGCNLLQKLPYPEPNKVISGLDNDPRLKEKIFRFSSLSISNLKKKASSEWQQGLGKISSFQALTALVWISTNRAQKTPAQTMATCVMPVDSRARFNPPLSPDQFGNLVLPLVVTCKAGELVKNGLGHAAMLIHQVVAGYDHNVVSEAMKAAMKNPIVMGVDKNYVNNDKINMLNFAWASKFDIYGVDFGLGKPVVVPSGKIDKKDGMVVVKAARDGGGSIDLEVSLCTESMIALESDQEFMEFAYSF